MEAVKQNLDFCKMKPKATPKRRNRARALALRLRRYVATAMTIIARMPMSN